MTNLLPIIISALIQIETGGHPDPADSVGDQGRAIGILQLHPIMVEEVNRITGLKYHESDRYSPTLSERMAYAFLEYQYRRGVTDPVALACRWNRPNGDPNPAYWTKVILALEGALQAKHDTTNNNTNTGE